LISAPASQQSVVLSALGAMQDDLVWSPDLRSAWAPQADHRWHEPW
jgi:hypothetical protein